MKKKKIVVVMFMAFCLAAVMWMNPVGAEAKATGKAMKYLKGTWVTAGNSQSEKVIFTRKYMKVYSLWNKEYTKVYSPAKKGKLLGKRKIISTKKKGSRWVIKVGKKGSYTYYKSSGQILECWWKDKSGWHYSGSDSLVKVKK